MDDAAAAMTERRRSLGLRIAEARKSKRWKQKQLAAAVHVEPMTVSRWETGKHAPDIDMLEKISQATSLPLSFFIDADDVSAIAPDSQLARIERQLEEVLGLLRELEGARAQEGPARRASARR
jgi:transcriptional regulator with XRE-family HTH domain